MSNSDKDLIITPNRGSSSADPKIVFSGASSSLGPQNITLQVYPTNSGTLSFEGSAGQLFSITNSLSGTIFSVNDVSGIPSIEVIDTGLVKLAQYGGNVLIGTGTDGGAKFQVSAGAPSGVGGLPSGTTMLLDSSSNNYLVFRNGADNGTYSGIAFQDNNVGGYVIFGNAGGGGDQLYIAGYGGVLIQYGTTSSIDRTARTTVATFNASGVTVNTGNFVGNVTGTATTATNWGSYGAVPAAGTSFGNANTIGRSDANGYTYFNYINSNTGSSENPAVGQVIVTTNSDNFYRKASIAHLTSAVQSNASGSWGINITGNAATATTFSTDRTNYSGITNGAVAGQMMWKQYGNNHTIFDASAGTSPQGGAVDRSTPANPVTNGEGENSWGWSPNLMGWNGSATYGLKVDFARRSLIHISDTAPTALGAGQLWWESDTGKLKIYYNDGSSSQWVDAVPIPDLTTYYSKAGGAISGPVTVNSSLTTTGIIYADAGIRLAQNTVAGSTSVSPGLLITNSDIRSAASSTWTGDPGTQGKIQYHSNRWYIVADSSSDRIVQFRRNASDVSYVDNSGNYVGNVTGNVSGSSGSCTGNAATATNISNSGTVTLATATESNAITITAPTYSTDTPVKLLNFDWYSNVFSIGNIRSGATPSNGLGFYYTASGGSRTEIGRFSTAGTFSAVAFNSTSDATLKENFEPITSPVEKISQLKGYTYNFRSDTEKRRHAGVVAQDVVKVLPEAVSDSDTRGLSVSYNDLVALLIEAVKEQQKQIEFLINKTTALETKHGI